VFSGAIHEMSATLRKWQSGKKVRSASRHDLLGTDYFSQGSIHGQSLFFLRQERSIKTFGMKKFKLPTNFEKLLGLISNPETNVFRLVHGEGDLLPVFDCRLLHGTAVIQRSCRDCISM